MQKNTVIQFNNVDVEIEGKTLLENITLHLYQGELSYLLGNTGTGKSSLLRTISLDLPVKKGQLFVNGIAIHQLETDEIPYLKRQLGIVNQHTILLPNLSVLQNLMLVLAAIGWKEESKKIERVQQTLGLFELGRIEEKKPQELTQVERIKVQLARAVLNNPTILLLDGILDSIDEASQDDIMRLVEQYKNINKVTVLLSTAHYQLTNRYSPDRIIVCKDKQIMEL